MKRIVVLCDGTWNRSDVKDPTNVVKVAQALAPHSADGAAQVAIYLEGVGSGRGVTRLARWSDKILGGALGWGLMDNVIEAYRHIVFMYEPDDEIYIFGFSRGAFTARSLTGFIRSTGIIDRDRLHLLPEAIARFRRPASDATHPNSEDSHNFRRRMSLRVSTSEIERSERDRLQMPEAPLVQMPYLGVWDTVGALGVPKHLILAPLLNGGSYQFHNLELTSLVQSGRHAIALDETRRSFEPTLWDNIDRLNSGHSAPDQPFQERYFAGDHGSVGGGGDIVDLSNIALEWIIDGAREAGLRFDPQELESIARQQDPNGPLHNFSQPRGGLADRMMRRNPKDRNGPATLNDLHTSARSRWASGQGGAPGSRYRPGSLKRIEPELVAFHEANPTHVA